MIHALFLVILIAFYLFIEFFTKNKSRKIQVVGMGLILFLFAALRAPTVGVDLQGYCENYEEMGKLSFKEIYEVKEGRDPAFSMLLKVLYMINPEEQFMLIVIGALVAISFSYFVYNQKGNALMLFILFITFRMYPFTLTGLRQAVALSICWFAFVLMQKGRTIPFILLTFFAALFHMSAIIFIIAWPIYRYAHPFWISVGTLLFAMFDLFTNHAIIMRIGNFLAQERFGGYLDDSEFTEFSGGGTFYLYIAFFVFITFAMLFMKEKIGQDKVFYRMFNVSCIAIMITLLCQNVPVLFRASYYFMLPFYALIAPSVAALFEKRRDRAFIYILMIILLCGQYVWLTPGAGITEYKFFWE